MNTDMYTIRRITFYLHAVSIFSTFVDLEIFLL